MIKYKMLNIDLVIEYHQSFTYFILPPNRLHNFQVQIRGGEGNLFTKIIVFVMRRLFLKSSH